MALCLLYIVNVVPLVVVVAEATRCYHKCLKNRPSSFQFQSIIFSVYFFPSITLLFCNAAAVFLLSSSLWHSYKYTIVVVVVVAFCFIDVYSKDFIAFCLCIPKLLLADLLLVASAARSACVQNSLQ